MEKEETKIVEWTPKHMLEITLNEPDDFLKIRETLTRIGVASRKDNKLFQSCHMSGQNIEPLAPLRQIKIIPFKEKVKWELCPKYNIGNK